MRRRLIPESPRSAHSAHLSPLARKIQAGDAWKWAQINREASGIEDLTPPRFRQLELEAEDFTEPGRRQGRFSGNWKGSDEPETIRKTHCGNF